MTRPDESPPSANGKVECNDSLARILDPKYDTEQGAMDVEPHTDEAESENGDTTAGEGFCIECEGNASILLHST